MKPHCEYGPRDMKRPSSPLITGPFLRTGFVEPWQRRANRSSEAISEHNEDWNRSKTHMTCDTARYVYWGCRKKLHGRWGWLHLMLWTKVLVTSKHHSSAVSTEIPVDIWRGIEEVTPSKTASSSWKHISCWVRRLPCIRFLMSYQRQEP